MGIGKRERFIVGALLLLLTPYIVWQWGISPGAYWRRAEWRRKSVEKEMKKKRKTIGEKNALRAVIAGYEQLVHRYPQHPKSAAARVMMVGLMEQGNKSDPHILEVRAGLSAFYGDRRAAAEVAKLRKDPNFGQVASEVLACLAPRRFTPCPSADTLATDTSSEGRAKFYALDTMAGQSYPLPLDGSQKIVPGTLTWRHDLSRCAFATTPSPRWVAGEGRQYGARWTVWVVDLKAGRLRAFLPSQPLPDLEGREAPLLVWSADGKRLKGGRETFVVE